MIFITGGTGQVGRALLKNLDEKHIPYDAPTRSSFNLDYPEQFSDYFKGKHFNAIIHLAAETDVDFCETERDIALTRNFTSTQVLARFASTNNIPIIFVSSSAVLSGDGMLMHGEDAEYSPSNYYGETKMLSEKFIVSSCSDYLIIRASWMLGNGKTVKKFAEIAFDKLSSDEPFSAVYDKFGSLTSAVGLSQIITHALSQNSKGIMHYSSCTPCSRYDIAKYIKNYIRSNSDIKPVEHSKFQLSAPRGFSEGLSGESISKNFGVGARTWEEELDSFLEDQK